MRQDINKGVSNKGFYCILFLNIYVTFNYGVGVCAQECRCSQSPEEGMGSLGAAGTGV